MSRRASAGLADVGDMGARPADGSVPVRGSRTRAPASLHGMENSAATASERDRRADRSPQAEQRRQAALRHVRQYPDPVLRRETAEVTEFDAELAALAERMYGIMQDAQGVGLAAPQLGLLLRVFTFQIGEDDHPEAVVNPRIVTSSDETSIEDEGCLSLSDVTVPVERPVAVTIAGKSLDGDDRMWELDGFAARVFQHEMDHLDGVLFIDRIKDPTTLCTWKEFARYHEEGFKQTVAEVVERWGS